MAKIKSFLDEIDYLGMAVEKSEQNKFFECLHYIHLGLKEYPEDFDLLIERAHVYSLMGVNDLALREYFFLLAYSSEFDDLEEIYVCILQCFMAENNFSSAIHYLKKSIELGLLEQEYGIYERLVQPSAEQEPYLRVYDANDSHEEALKISKQLMYSGQYGTVEKILREVPAKSNQFIEANCLLSLLYVTQGDGDKAKKHCDKVLEKEPQSIFALSTKLIACDMLAQFTERTEIMQQLRQLEITDVHHLGKVATAMQQIGQDGEAAYYISKMLKIKPYDREMLLLGGIAHTKSGQLEEARELLSTLLKINPSDKVAQYYNGEISKYCARDLTRMPAHEARDSESQLPSGSCGKSVAAEQVAPDFSSFVYSLNLPRAEVERRTQYIREALGAKKWAEIKNDSVLLEYIEWALATDESELSELIASKLVKYSSWREYMRTMLVDRETSIIQKKVVLTHLLVGGKDKSFLLLVDEIIKEFEPTIPHRAADFPRIFSDSYWIVYSVLATTESDFDSKLNSAFRKILAGMEIIKERIKDREALCAVLMYMSKINSLYSKKDYCIELFFTDTTTFNFYYEFISKSK